MSLPSKAPSAVTFSDADDQHLVQAHQKGDVRAFRELYERYERKAYAVAFGFLRNQEDALDVVQEAFIKVHRSIDGFEAKSSFYTWLYRIVANGCIDHLRKRTRRPDVMFDDGLSPGVEASYDGPLRPFLSDPRQALDGKEVLAAVGAALEELSDNHRKVIVMRELQGMSYAEMATAMECSKGTIMSRLFHARRNLAAKLRPRLELEDSSDDVQAAEGPPAAAQPVGVGSP